MWWIVLGKLVDFTIYVVDCTKYSSRFY